MWVKAEWPGFAPLQSHVQVNFQMISFPPQRAAAPTILPPPPTTPAQRTPQELQIRQMTGDAYDERLTAHDNLVSALRAGAIRTAGEQFILSDFTFHLQDGETLTVPAQVTLVDCRVTGGRVICAGGTLQSGAADVNPFGGLSAALTNKIGSYLSKQDSRRFSLADKNLSSTLSLRPTLPIHAWRPETAQDHARFASADHLIRLQHYQLPEMQRAEQSFSDKSEFMSYLVHHCDDLYIHLRTQPGRINEQDEEGMTLLHHAASIGLMMGSNSAAQVHQLLFDTPGINFNLKDSNGNTAVHVAAHHAWDRVTCRYIFPNYVRKAIEQGFDFSTRGRHGYTVMHLAALHAYRNPLLGRDKNLSNILTILIGHQIPNLKSVLNALSDSGSTAIFYAINRLSFDEALALLEAGADPELCGSSARTPMIQIARFKEECRKQEAGSDPAAAQRLEKTLQQLSEFEALLEKHIALK